MTITFPSDAPLTNLGGHTVKISPDGRRIAYLGNDVERGRMLFVRDIGALESQAVPGSENAVDPFFSPDGEWIGFESGAERGFLKVAVGGGPPLAILTGFDQPITGGSWGADDAVIFTTLEGMYRVPAAGGAPAEQLAEAPESRQMLQPHILPGGHAVLFATRRGGVENDRVSVLSLDTGEQHILLEGITPSYVPSGHLVFVRGTTLMAVPFDLDTLQVSGDTVALVEEVRRFGAAHYALADNGTLVYVPGEGGVLEQEFSLAWVDREGRVEPVAAPRRAYRSPDVSPDGTRVVLEVANQEDDIWSWDFTRGILTRLTFFQGFDGLPVWTPDGRQLVFSSVRDGAINLFWRMADGTGTVERLTESSFGQTPYSVSPDGTRLVFGQESSVTEDLFMMSMEGDRAPEVLLQTDFNERNAEISPDGRWLVYEADDSGQFEVYVRPFPDVNSGRWQISIDGGVQPRWAPDGRELFYIDPGDTAHAKGSLMAVSVQTEPTFAVGNVEILFDGGSYLSVGSGRIYDVAPDGQRFLVMSAERGSSSALTGIVVVQN